MVTPEGMTPGADQEQATTLDRKMEGRDMKGMQVVVGLLMVVALVTVGYAEKKCKCHGVDISLDLKPSTAIEVDTTATVQKKAGSNPPPVMLVSGGVAVIGTYPLSAVNGLAIGSDGLDIDSTVCSQEKERIDAAANLTGEVTLRITPGNETITLKKKGTSWSCTWKPKNKGTYTLTVTANIADDIQDHPQSDDTDYVAEGKTALMGRITLD